MTAGFPLTGVDPADPIPGIIREIRFAQGDAVGVGSSRPVIMFGNKTTDGSETVETVGDPINGLDDMIARFGQRSELTLMYRTYAPVDPDATIHCVAIAENGSAAAATVDFTFATTATGATTVKITCIGETVEVGVETSDTVTTIAGNVVTKINSQTHWPVTAANIAGVVTATTAQAGVRPKQYLNAMRMAFSKAQGTTVTKGSVGGGTGADDNTLALAAAAKGEWSYHVGPYDLSASPSSTDNGVGEHAAQITSEALPNVGKDQQLIVASTTATHSQADTGAATLNNSLVQVVPCPNNDWASSMLAARMAAVIRREQISHPAANLTNYGTKDGQILGIPDPYSKSDRPSKTQQRAHLNNGCTVINWTNTGSSYVVRQVTSRCKLGSNYDYRVREGHIPSAIFYFWQAVRSAYLAQAQAFVSEDPTDGAPPLEGVTYPSGVKSLVARIMDDMTKFPGGPVLDPGVLQKMKDTINAVAMTDGISLRARPVASRHNNKGQFLIEETSLPY